MYQSPMAPSLNRRKNVQLVLCPSCFSSSDLAAFFLSILHLIGSPFSFWKRRILSPFSCRERAHETHLPPPPPPPHMYFPLWQGTAALKKMLQDITEITPQVCCCCPKNSFRTYMMDRDGEQTLFDQIRAAAGAYVDAIRSSLLDPIGTLHGTAARKGKGSKGKKGKILISLTTIICASGPDSNPTSGEIDQRKRHNKVCKHLFYVFFFLSSHNARLWSECKNPSHSKELSLLLRDIGVEDWRNKYAATHYSHDITYNKYWCYRYQKLTIAYILDLVPYTLPSVSRQLKCITGPELKEYTNHHGESTNR